MFLDSVMTTVLRLTHDKLNKIIFYALKFQSKNTPATSLSSVFQLLTVVQTSRATLMPAVSKFKQETRILYRGPLMCELLLQILQQIFGIEHCDERGGGSRDDDDGSPGPFSQNKQTNKAKQNKSVLKCTVI